MTARTAAGMTQADLAFEMRGRGAGKIGPGDVSRIEVGATKRIGPDKLRALAQVLDVSADYLLEITDDPRPAAELADEVARARESRVARRVAQSERAQARGGGSPRGAGQ